MNKVGRGVNLGLSSRTHPKVNLLVVVSGL